MGKNDPSKDTSDEGDLPVVLKGYHQPAVAETPVSTRAPRSTLEERAIDEGDPRMLEAGLDGWTFDLHQPHRTT